MSTAAVKQGRSAHPRTIGSLVRERLGPVELRRRAHHMLPGLLPFLLWIIPHPHPWIVAAIVAAAIVAGAILTFVQFDCIQRKQEVKKDCVVAVLGYAACVLAALFLFAPRLEVAFLVLGVLAFGDGSATLGGMMFGRWQLPWNPGKTVAGTACFLLVGVPMATILYWGEAHRYWGTGTHGLLPLHWHPSAMVVAVVIAFVTATTAAIAESLPSRTNDNLRVGVTAMIMASLMQVLLVGWP
jgi:dolichol kinase